MKVTAKIAALAAVAVLGTASAAWAVPTVSGVSMAQLPGTWQVQITYALTGEDAIVTLSIETNGVAFPDSTVTRLTGDVNKKVAPGSRTMMWNAGADWPTNVVNTAKARVTAWRTDAPPQIMVIDLSGGKDAATYPVAYYPSAEALPYGGLTNTMYKSSHLVLSKIAKGAFNMGAGICRVTLTNDFYAGVFEVTYGQWSRVMGSTRVPTFSALPNVLYRPMQQVSYCDIRENPAGNSSAISPNWPQSSVPGATSFMGLLQTKTAVGFDLPTEAQWEYACRAGTTSYYNDGLEDVGLTTDVGGQLSARMNVLGRFVENKGDPQCSAIVGSYLPNAWGLYDMHGNVREFCLDWRELPLAGGIDPRGPVTGTSRVLRNGAWNSAATDCSSVFSTAYNPVTRGYIGGFRLAWTLP